jgi:hypothetical protein
LAVVKQPHYPRRLTNSYGNRLAGLAHSRSRRMTGSKPHGKGEIFIRHDQTHAPGYRNPIFVD